MSRITSIRTREGEQVPFRRSRIVRAILAAVRAAGSSEEWIADKVADMVVYFLDVQYGERVSNPPTQDEVDDTIERALRATPDLAGIARAFIDNRQQRNQLRELEESINAVAPTPDTRQVTQQSRSLEGWNRARITAALVRENGLAPGIASEVAQAVEKRVDDLKLPRLTTGLIRELVDVELLQRGLITDGRPSSISVPRYDLEQWLFPRDDALEASPSQEEFAGRAASRVLADFTLSSLHSAPSRDAHLSGDLHLEGLHAPAAIAGLTLSAPALLAPGAGFGLIRVFPGAAMTATAAFARIAQVLRDAQAICHGTLTLERLDRALAPVLKNEPRERARQVLAEGLALLASQVTRKLRVTVGPPTGEASDSLIFALIDTLAGEDPAPRAHVELVLALSPANLADPVHAPLIERAASSASFCGQPVFRFREQASRGPSGLFGDSGAGPHDALVARAAINLARPAIGTPTDDLGSYLATLDKAVERAVAAMGERVRFIERVAMRNLPEPAARSSRMLRALMGPGREVALTPAGLTSAAALLSGEQDPASPKSQRVLQQIVSYLGFKFAALAETAGLRGSLSGSAEEPADLRLLREDRIRAPRQPLSAYTLGVSMTGIRELPVRLGLEAALHAALGRDARAQTGEVSPRLTRNGVQTLLARYAAGGGPRPAEIEISVQHRLCRDCGNQSPAELQSCPVCGSTAWAVAAGQRDLFS
ncbi:MAG: hypothetical protein IT462_07555 [Planctomycetes bacterium]|nr:hypothetical protein [Planctomycetota bacterium]